MDQAFHDAMATGYALTEPGVILGSPMHDGELANDARVQVALSMLNRHGLIAGATGTGKTKTLQLMAGQLSKSGVPVFVADIKGDLTGLAAPGDGTNAKVIERVTSMGWTFEASAHPVEYLSLSGASSVPRSGPRSTRSGPLLLGKVLDLNDTQTSILALIFKYCDDNDLPAARPQGPGRTTLKFLSSDEGKPILADYGGMSPASVGVLLRSLVVLEQEGADVFFGEPEFEVADLLRTTPDGEGVDQLPRAVRRHGQAPACSRRSCSGCWPSCTRACPRPATCPSPSCASSSMRRTCSSTTRAQALLDQVERTARLIRSKGVGRLFRDPGADRRPVVRSSPSSATASSTRSARSRPTTPTRCARPPGPSRRRRSTTSRRRSRRWARARRWSRSCRRGACRHPWPRPVSCRRIR